jgi:hypothetical protein
VGVERGKVEAPRGEGGCALCSSFGARKIGGARRGPFIDRPIEPERAPTGRLHQLLTSKFGPMEIRRRFTGH